VPYRNIEKRDAQNNQEYLPPIEKEQLIQFLKQEFSIRKMLLEIE